MKANCPLLSARPVRESDPTILRIIDGRQVRDMAMKARVRAFHLVVEKARATPDVIIDMYLFSILSR